MRWVIGTLVAAACAPALDPVEVALDQAPPPGSFLLDTSPLVRGGPLTLTATGVAPGVTVTFAASPDLTGAGVCPPGIRPSCLELAAPVYTLGTAVADAGGVASLSRTPGPAVPGRFEVQAGAVIGGRAYLSNSTAVVVLPGPGRASLETRPWSGEGAASVADVRRIYAEAELEAVGYGWTLLPDTASFSNQTTLGGYGSSIVFHFAVAIWVDPPGGAWSFRYGPDFGGGGALLVDGAEAASRWSDMWWGGDWATPDATLMVADLPLTPGYHMVEVFGLEGGADGAQAFEVLAPGSPGWAPL